MSEKLTEEFRKGYIVRNLNNMRAFYVAFPNWNELRTNLSWTHCRIVAPITSSLKKSDLPVHVFIENDIDGLEKDSFVLLEQIKTLDCRRLKEYIRCLDDKTLSEIDKALMISFGIDVNYK